MKVLVTGVKGQLGSDLVHALKDRGVEVVSITRAEIDFAEPDSVARKIAAHKADWVVNCAAYTAVDKAESEIELAYRVNSESAGEVARAVAQNSGRLVHISTDFIFDGNNSTPYTENDSTGPLGIYGDSKLKGEVLVKQYLPNAVILRTAWVYGMHGHNFVKTMLRLAGERDELRVVDDQIGSPSWTVDISRAILGLIDGDHKGVFNFTNEGVASWYDFAVAILDEATKLGFPIRARSVRAIPTADFPLPATRPSYSVLSKYKIRNTLDMDIPHWRKSLVNMLEQLK